jgi:inosine triphosphate pyrophosphatase
MVRRKLLFITGNKNKLLEAKKILPDFDIESRKIDLPELQEVNEALIVEDKIRRALQVVDSEIFVEDTSLCFDALNGLPGPLVKWFEHGIGNRGLVDMLSAYENKVAYAKCYVGYGIPARDGKKEKILVFEGVMKGSIVEPAGQNNFGWDVIFMPDGYDKTYAQMTEEEKFSNSHRSIAMRKLKEYLEKNGE